MCQKMEEAITLSGMPDKRMEQETFDTPSCYK